MVDEELPMMFKQYECFSMMMHSECKGICVRQTSITHQHQKFINSARYRLLSYYGWMNHEPGIKLRQSTIINTNQTSKHEYISIVHCHRHCPPLHFRQNAQHIRLHRSSSLINNIIITRCHKEIVQKRHRIRWRVRFYCIIEEEDEKIGTGRFNFGIE